MFDAYFLLFLKKLKVIVSSVLTMKRGYQSPTCSIMVVWKTARLLQFFIGKKWTEKKNACTCSRHGVWRYLVNYFVFKHTFKFFTTLTSRYLPEYYQYSICWIPSTIFNRDYNYVCSKQKGANKWYFITSLLQVSCSHRQDLSKISSFNSYLSVESYHQMTQVTTKTQSAGTCLYYHPQSSWLIVLQLDWKHTSCGQQNKSTIRL